MSVYVSVCVASDRLSRYLCTCVGLLLMSSSLRACVCCVATLALRLCDAGVLVFSGCNGALFCGMRRIGLTSGADHVDGGNISGVHRMLMSPGP